MKNNCCNINEAVQDYYDFLKSYILKKTNSVELAEDLVQEVMIKLVEAHQQSKPIKNVKAWLFQVSRNTIYDYFKKHYVTVELDEDWKINSLKDDSSLEFEAADYIISMIDMLPEKDSLLLKMSDIDSIPQKQIAFALNIGLSATKMRLQRARKKLKNLFVECCDIEFDKDGNFVGCSIKPYCEPLQQLSDQFQKIK